MPLRAALAAVLLSSFSPVRADPPAPAEPAAAVLDRAADSHATVRTLRVQIQAMPENTVKKQVLPFLDGLDRKASDLPPEKREAFINQNLPELTALARTLTPETAPREVLRGIQNSAAYLNNRANRWEEGRRFSEQVLSRDPEDRDALLSRSNASYGLKDFKGAFQDADKAARLAPDDPCAYTARALASYGLAEYLKTLEDSRRALAINPNDRTAYALMHLAEGRIPPVPMSGDAQSRLEVEVQREYHGMVTQMTQVEARSQQLPPAPETKTLARLIRNAASKISLKDYYGAIADADQALAEDPNNSAAYYYRAAAYNLIGQYDNAVSNASQALSIDPTEVAARDARAWAYNRQGRFRDALADANHSLEINPKNPYAFANRGFANEKMGNLEAMLQDLKTAAQLNPQFEPVYHDAAASYGIDLPPARPAQPAAPTPAAPLRKKQFLAILASSVLGGLLIALGLVHVFGGALARRMAPAAPAPPAVRDLREHSSIDESYAIGRSLGQGGMGVVYEAVDKALGRKVAVKMLLDEFQIDAKAKEQFLDEARTVAALHHPNIVDIHSIVSDQKGLYLVFEFISGDTVADLLARRKRLTLSEAKAIVGPVCSALQFAHERKVVHRDLKPSNIMLAEGRLVKVMDFGISRRIKDTLGTARGGPQGYAVTNSVVGTPYYMAPEQEYGVIRPESDIYSLGTCVYEMLTGLRPYPPPATYSQKMSGEYTKASVATPELPRSLDLVIAGALHPDPDKRTRSAADFWSLLDAVRDPEAGVGPS